MAKAVAHKTSLSLPHCLRMTADCLLLLFLDLRDFRVVFLLRFCQLLVDFRLLLRLFRSALGGCLVGVLLDLRLALRLLGRGLVGFLLRLLLFFGVTAVVLYLLGSRFAVGRLCRFGTVVLLLVRR